MTLLVAAAVVDPARQFSESCDGVLMSLYVLMHLVDRSLCQTRTRI